MLQRISTALARAATWPALLLATAVFALFLATVMPQQSADSRTYAGDWGAPDGHFFYSPDEFYGEVATWGVAGRQDYVSFRLGLDIGWGLAYTAFLVTALGCAARRAFPPGDRRRLVNLAPLPTLLLDYAENALGIFLVSAWPDRHELLAWVAAALTAAKWTTHAAAWCLLCVVTAVAIRERRRRAGAQ